MKIEDMIKTMKERQTVPPLNDLRRGIAHILKEEDLIKALNDFVALKDYFDDFEADYEFNLQDALDSAEYRFFDSEDIEALKGDTPSDQYYRLDGSAPYYTHNDTGQAVNLTLAQIKHTLNHLVESIDLYMNTKPYIVKASNEDNIKDKLFNIVVNSHKNLDDLVIECDGKVYDTFSYGHELGSNLPLQFSIAHYLDTKTGSYIKVTYELHYVKENHYQGIRDITNVEII